MEWINNIKFDDRGLVPAIIQGEDGTVLMLAYMNKESLTKTIETRYTWFFSRSRKTLWNKGATSGNKQKVVNIQYDCDGDTLLIKVQQRGAPCHTGEATCFFNDTGLEEKEDDLKHETNIFSELYNMIQKRKETPLKGSYTNYLLEKGKDKILKKIGEESSEVIIGAKNDNREEVIYEVSDLVYHTLVLLVDMGIKVEDIEKELISRKKPD